MADKTFDAVIIGGGTKALFLSLYLRKYGGMSVGIFERRHEIGGALATEEIAAPGFRGNTHASIQLPWYYLPIYRDFPEFWEYGARIDQYKVSDGAIFKDNNTCLTIYSDKHDFHQEKTAQEIARFSERDADRWLKLRELSISPELQRVHMDMLFNPLENQQKPEIFERQAKLYEKLIEIDMAPDSLVLASSHMRLVKEYWESPEMQYVLARFALSCSFDVNQPGSGQSAFGIMASPPSIGFARGGTHQVAHAAHKLLVQMGVEFFTHCEVEKAIIENGEAKGIRLSDGTQIKANKLVVSAGLNPKQLVFDIIGKEHFTYQNARRIELLEATFGCLMWYTFAAHEAPQYDAASFNPDINHTYWLGLTDSADPGHVSRECLWAQLGKWPPKEDNTPVVWRHSDVDPSYAPPGKQTLSSEQLGPPATSHTVSEWMELKEKYTENLLDIWKDYAPNMTWDNIIGVDTNSPLDHCRLKNMSPTGAMATIDHVPYQFGENRPTPELSNHRTPIKNLYGTGSGWYVGGSSGSAEGYNCYKIIARDMGLPGPWEESGKEEPESLYEQWKIVMGRLHDAKKREEGGE